MANTTLMSFAEFERLDGGADQLELMKGELIRVPPPYADHMEIAKRVFRLVDDFVERLRAEGAPLGPAFIEMGYKFSTTPVSWLRPDVSVNHLNQRRENFYLGAPLIAFEVVSEYDNAKELDAKVAEHLANGSQEVWVIYPKTRHAIVHGPGAAIRKESQAIRTDLLPGLAIPFESVL